MPPLLKGLRREHTAFFFAFHTPLPLPGCSRSGSNPGYSITVFVVLSSSFPDFIGWVYTNAPMGVYCFSICFSKTGNDQKGGVPCPKKHTIYCLGEVLLALDADAPLAHAESFRPRLGGDAAVLAQACAAQGGCASLLAQLGEDPFGHRAASTLAAAGVDTTHASFSRTLPTALLFEAGGEALSYRVRTAGLQFAPEQLEPGLFQPGDALLFASSGLCDSPLRYTHLAALTAARDAGALTCFVPCLEPALWPQPEREAALREVTRQLLPRADIVLSPRKSWNFCSARRRCGWRFSSLAGAHPAGAFGPRRGHPRLYPHEPCILAGALPPCPAAGRQGALLFAAKKQHAGKTAPPHHQAVTNDLIRNAQSPRRSAGALLRKVSNSEKIVGCLVSG